VELPIPRANMYKYAALSGVAIIIVTLVFSVSQIFRIEDHILDVEERILVMEARLQTGASADGGAPRSELDRKLDEIRLEAARRKLEVLENRAFELKEWATIAFTIGIAIAAYGFTRWYRKIQLPMERIAQHRSEQHVTQAESE